MKDYRNYIEAIWIGAGAIFLIGFVFLSVAEIFLLKKKGWLDDKISLRYPIITNIINILTAPIAFVFIFYISAFAFMIILTINAPPVPVYIFFFFVTFFGYFIAFSLVRFVTTSVLAKSSNLTWKYVMGQSIFPSILLIIVTFLFIATLYM